MNNVGHEILVRLRSNLSWENTICWVLTGKPLHLTAIHCYRGEHWQGKDSKWKYYQAKSLCCFVFLIHNVRLITFILRNRFSQENAFRKQKLGERPAFCGGVLEWRNPFTNEITNLISLIHHLVMCQYRSPETLPLWVKKYLVYFEGWKIPVSVWSWWRIALS